MKRSTWTVLVLFLVLAAGMYLLNQREPVFEELVRATAIPVEFLFAEFDGIPTSISIKNDTGEQVTVMRNEAGAWVLKQPIEADANQGSVEAAATQLTTLRIISHPEVAPDIAGLNPPSYTLIVELTGGKEKSIYIGDLTPTTSGYYASVNGGDDVVIVGKEGLEALLILLESPSYENTPLP